MIEKLSPTYRSTLQALSENDLGRAFILARNGLQAAERAQDGLEACAHQALFARIHLQDGDPDSARRALKLMKRHQERLTGEALEWAEAEHALLSEKLKGF